MKEIKSREFANGKVYMLETEDGYPIEVTDTFLPRYTKDCINENSNKLKDAELGSRLDRWMIGVSVMSGCPVGCKFCATGSMKRCRNLTSSEILDQITFIIEKNPTIDPRDCFEFKINFTRMGEPFLNIHEVKAAISSIQQIYLNVHCYVSTIGIDGSTFDWIKNKITLQFSLHSLDSERRDWLIPYRRKMSIEQMGQVRTESELKTTINLTLVDEQDFDIDELKKYFDPEHFFIKLSPINPNEMSEKHGLGCGVITATNVR
jgi:23S rRNA (adenine2503-C2)-methyltransferase